MLIRPRVVPVLVAVGAAVFVGINGVNALNKGGDFLVFLEGGHRLLEGTPLYVGSSVGFGFIGPPFQAVLFVPFALLGSGTGVVPRLAWYATNLLALAAGIWCWVAALGASLGVRRGTHVTTGGWHRVLLPLVAVLFPLQTNFEHQNLNAVLLALTGGAALLLERNRDVGAGVLVGCAAALKAYPAFLSVYLVATRRWTAAAVSVLVALLLTMIPAARYGVSPYRAMLGSWLDLSARGGWPARGNNQSLFAMLARYGGADALSSPGPWVYPSWLAGAAVFAAILLAIVARHRPPVALGLAVSLGVAVVLSPIAWDHYWVLFFPALYALYNAPAHTAPWARAVFWPAALLISGFSRVTVGAGGLWAARQLSTFTVAGLAISAAMLRIAAAWRPGGIDADVDQRPSAGR
jgi:hypothetical protein